MEKITLRQWLSEGLPGLLDQEIPDGPITFTLSLSCKKGKVVLWDLQSHAGLVGTVYEPPKFED